MEPAATRHLAQCRPVEFGHCSTSHPHTCGKERSCLGEGRRGRWYWTTQWQGTYLLAAPALVGPSRKRNRTGNPKSSLLLLANNITLFSLISHLPSPPPRPTTSSACHLQLTKRDTQSSTSTLFLFSRSFCALRFRFPVASVQPVPRGAWKLPPNNPLHDPRTQSLVDLGLTPSSHLPPSSPAPEASSIELTTAHTT